jgi:hypothetical protein
MMFAVAVAAVAMAVVEGLTVRRREQVYRQKAAAFLARELGERTQEEIYGKLARLELKSIANLGQMYQWQGEINSIPGMSTHNNKLFMQSLRERAKTSAMMGQAHVARSKRSAARVAYYAAMKKKYQAAAARPWQVVAPDPPLPPPP